MLARSAHGSWPASTTQRPACHTHTCVRSSCPAHSSRAVVCSARGAGNSPQHGRQQQGVPQPDSNHSSNRNQRPHQQQQEHSRHVSGRGGGRGGGRGSGRGGRGSGRSSAALPADVKASMARTQAIKAADTPGQLLQVVQQHAADLDDINLSAAFTKAVQLCCKRTQPPSQPAAVQQLLAQLQQLVQRLKEDCGARQLANIIWSCERLGTDTAAQLLPLFLQSSKLQQAKPQEISNVLLAVAKLQLQLTAGQLQDMLQQLMLLLPDAKPQEVSNTLWAVASMGQQVPPRQLEPLLHHFQEVLHSAKLQEVSNTLWAVASMGQQIAPRQLERMLHHFQQVLHSANPQDVSNTLWAVASMGQQVAPRQLEQLLHRFQEVLQLANPQEVSNTLWAVATMGQQVPPRQLQQMLDRFQQVLHLAKPQGVSNTLWAVPIMQQQVPAHQLQQILQQLQTVLAEANPQNVSNTLLACAKLQFVPLQLLSALQQQPELLGAANPQHLANMAWACGQLGYRDKQLPGSLLQQAVQLLLQSAGGAGSFEAQNVCNLCWSAAVLDMQQCVPLVLPLAAAVSQLHGSLVEEGLQQLYQVHLWLLDSALPEPGQGLSTVLSQQQLELCRASWEQQLAVQTALSKTSAFQRDVFAAVQQLPAGFWHTSPQLEQVTADGALSIDIAGTTAAGVRVAIEADGPSHFIQPGNTFTGGTLFRNRALVARGYAVVSILYWEWDAQRGAEQRQKYLLAKLQGLQQHSTHPTQQQSAGSTTAAPQPAPAARKRRTVRRPGTNSTAQQQQPTAAAEQQLAGVAAAAAATTTLRHAAETNQGSPRMRRRRTKA